MSRLSRSVGRLGFSMAALIGVLILFQRFTIILPVQVDVEGGWGVVSDPTARTDSGPEMLRAITVKVSDPMQVPVAVVSRVVRDVNRKEAHRQWEVARRGEALSSGDKVKTGENSVAVIKFHDHSLVRVRERSELTIIETMAESAASRSVNLERGGVGFDIKKQRNGGQFRFSSPVSVASIRGTEGRFVSGGQSDTLTVLEGMVELTNGMSLDQIEVRAGYTGISTCDGTIWARLATPDELRVAGSAAQEEAETIPVASRRTLPREGKARVIFSPTLPSASRVSSAATVGECERVERRSMVHVGVSSQSLQWWPSASTGLSLLPLPLQ